MCLLVDFEGTPYPWVGGPKKGDTKGIVVSRKKAKMAKNPKAPHNIKCNDQSKQVEQKWGSVVSDSFSFGAQFSPNSLIVF